MEKDDMYVFIKKFWKKERKLTFKILIDSLFLCVSFLFLLLKFVIDVLMKRTFV